MSCFSCFLSATITILLNYLIVFITAQTNNYVYHYCGTTGNFTKGSTYATNLNQLLSSLSSNVSTSNGYQNITTGQDPDRLYGSFLCRGDSTTQFCKTCVDSAMSDIIKRCPNQKESIIFFDYCVLRYSNQSFFSIMQTQPGGYIWNDVNATNPKVFNRVLEDLLNSLVEGATNGSSKVLFSTKALNFTSSEKIYGLVQCTPDITPQECEACLRVEIHQIPMCCDGRQGVRFIQPSCNLRYQTYRFYESRDVSTAPSPSSPVSPVPPPPPPLTNSTAPKGNGKNSSRTVVIAVIPSTLGLILLCTITFSLCRRKRHVKQTAKRTVHSQGLEVITTVESLQFDLETVRAATDDFSDANKLGEGGFGPVYMGQLSDGQKIAVKRLSRQSVQGDGEFKNEVVLVSKLQHRNLVRLLGFCFEGQERLLIYEFVLNGSLDRFIFDPVKRADLSWETCYRIIGGIARGILYLHEDSRHRVIHRDLKASNILLDAEMNPKISDFGMARLFVVDQTQGSTSMIAGTYGYMAPEYANQGYFSVKSDVYSFGVLLLEIVTGQKNSSFNQSETGENLLSHAWRHWKERKALQLVDPIFRSSYLVSEAVRCIHLGLLCVQENFADRPTMGSVVVMLTSYSVSLALPSRPAFFVNCEKESSLVTSLDRSHSREPEQVSMANSTLYSVNEASITEIYPR